MIENLQGEAALIPGFTLGESWQGATTVLPCKGKSRDARFQEAVRLLKSAGYSWEKEPANAVLPSGIKAPDDSLLPPFKLLAPAQDVDSLRASAAAYIVEQARLLGINVEVNLGSIDSIQYAVYGSGEYDMALLGWRLSSYPAYLCTWFTPVGENPFSYSQARLLPVCEEFNQATSLPHARALADEIQAILLNDLPLIPLYVSTRYDAYRNVRFPFAEVLDGLAGVYGAPVLTLPIR
jgi:ABC-type transport system substrate-binding protein